MMSLNVSKKIKQPALVCALICSLPSTHAWVTPVNMDTDQGNGGRKVIETSLGDVDRCDTTDDEYVDIPKPDRCHRRNLIWQLGSKSGDPEVAVPLAQWNPELGDDTNWRLPTIKELSRLVDYSSYRKGREALTDQPLILNMFPTEAAGFTPVNSWLISSTYRDIDGDAANGQAQIFGMNMGTGEIAAFDTVISTGVNTDASSEEIGIILSSNWDIELSQNDEFSRTESIDGDNKIEVIERVTSSVDNMDGTFTINGDRITNVFPISLKKCDSLNEDGTCNLSVADVYALLVHIDTVSELIAP